MPTVTEQTIDGYVSCIDPRCPGYEQRPVQVVRRTQAFTYQELGATGGTPASAIERESVGIVQTDETCEHCGKPVIYSEELRPEYAQVSGSDQLALLNLNQQKQVHEVQLASAQQGQQTAEMMALIQQQRVEMAEMKAELQRRRGGRPPKDEGDSAA